MNQNVWSPLFRCYQYGLMTVFTILSYKITAFLYILWLWFWKLFRMHGIAQFTHSNNEINIHIIVNLHFWLSDLNGILIICIRHTQLLSLSKLRNISMEFSSLVSFKKSSPKIWADGNEQLNVFVVYLLSLYKIWIIMNRMALDYIEMLINDMFIHSINVL